VQKISPGETKPPGPGSDLSGLTDEALMNRVAGDGDEVAFALLVARWTGPLMGRCSWIIRNDAIAQEITQETFMRIWRSKHTWTHTKSFAAWAFEICGNRSIDAINDMKGDASGHIEASKPVQTGEPEDLLGRIPDRLPPISVEYRIAIAECMKKLLPLDREFLGLKFWKGMSIAEIGTNLLNANDPKLAEYRAHTIQARAYKALRKCLERKGKTDVVFPESDSLLDAGAPEIGGADS
jgi:RNA polymerase sigma-70 factor (ECF subfamily)